MAIESDIKAMLARARRMRPNGRPRSRVRLLLEDQFDELAANPPSWTRLADLLNEEGHRDASGERLTGHVLASIFNRIRAQRQGANPLARVPSRATTVAAPEPSDAPFEIRAIKPKETP